jgi:signal transduction histidine kinase
MSTDLAHATQSRRQITADIAHDLRTPLTVIGGYLESMCDGVLKPTPDRLEMMHTEVHHLQRLVDDLRTLSLADAGKLTLNKHEITPDNLLMRVADIYQLPAENIGVTLQVRIAPDLPLVHVDEERMVQVLSNLVSNALRYTPNGGQITLEARRCDDSVLLSVEDTGIGITSEALSRIFERFYRADRARQQSEGESGLGLAIARSIIEAHGGTIAVESEMGRGTKFIIALPVHT